MLRVKLMGFDPIGVLSLAEEGGGDPFPKPRWFNPLNSAVIDDAIAAGDYLAWRARSTPASVWGPGPSNYDASLVSVEGSSSILTEGNGAVPWTQASGWEFVAAALHYFLTGIIPTSDQAYAVFVQFAGVANDTSAAIGADNPAGNDTFQIIPRFGGAQVAYSNGGNVIVAPVLNAGNLAIVGSQCYRNGATDDGAIPAWGNPSIRELYVGCRNTNGVPQLFITASVSSLLIVRNHSVLTLADIEALAALPDGSMHNL